MWELEQRLKCGSCGTIREEWDDDPIAYVADVTNCPGCETLEVAMDQDSGTGKKQFGLKYQLIKRDKNNRPRNSPSKLTDPDDTSHPTSRKYYHP